MSLTELAVRKAKPAEKPRKMTDGGGLYLLVHPNGGKYWQLAYRFDGKQKTLSIGVYPTVTMADAREQRSRAKKQLSLGIDPSFEKKETKRVEQSTISNSFFSLAVDLHGIKSPNWTPGHAKQWLGNLEKYAFPIIGSRHIDEIEPMEIVGIMRNIEANGTYETRDRLLQSISSIFKFSIATGRAKYNPAEIRMALVDRPKVEHFKCISTAEIPDFLRAVTTYQHMGKVSPIAIAALRILMLTATRTSEVRYSKWVDFDLDAGCWVIPAAQVGRKGKGDNRNDHAVPLSTQAISILRSLQPITGHCDFVFANRNTAGKAISENTVLKIIETIGYKKMMTGHGFRSMARTMMGELGHRREVLEAMLSHSLGNQTEAAYVRTTYFSERQQLMQQFADLLDDAEKNEFRV